MNDIEQDLRELFRDRADSLTAPPAAPAQVLRRGRRRQVRTILIAGATTIAVVLASFAGLHALPRDTGIRPADEVAGVGAAHTLGVSPFTVTAPAGWTLIDWWPAAAYMGAQSSSSSFTAIGKEVGPDGSSSEPSPGVTVTTTKPSDLPGGLPLFQVANFDPGLVTLQCSNERQELTGDQATLVLSYDIAAAIEGGTLPSLTALDPSTPPREGPCGTGWYERFAVADVPYLGFLGTGPETPGSVRTTLFDTFARMEQDGATLGPPIAPGPGYVLASGLEGGNRWRLEAGWQAPGELDAGGSPVAGITLVADPGPHVANIATPADPLTAQAFGTPERAIVFGRAASNVDRVAYVPLSGEAIDATALDFPSWLRDFAGKQGVPLEDRIFFVLAPAGDGVVRAALADGSTVSVEPGYDADLLPTKAPTVVPSPVGESMRIDGEVLGTPWHTDVFGNPADGSQCLSFVLDGESLGECPTTLVTDSPDLHVQNTGDGLVLWGTVPVPADVDRVQVRLSPDAVPVGPDVFEPIELPGWPKLSFLLSGMAGPSGDVTLRFLDADGQDVYPAVRFAWTPSQVSESGQATAASPS